MVISDPSNEENLSAAGGETDEQEHKRLYPTCYLCKEEKDDDC